jgi:hypothetical protein
MKQFLSTLVPRSDFLTILPYEFINPPPENKQITMLFELDRPRVIISLDIVPPGLFNSLPNILTLVAANGIIEQSAMASRGELRGGGEHVEGRHCTLDRTTNPN